MFKGPIFRTEIRWASLILAYMSLKWASRGMDETHDFKSLLDWYEIDTGWVFMQVMCGVLLTVGAITHHRSWLHMGLALSAFVWLSFVAVLNGDNEGSFAAFGLFSLILLIEDVRRRPTSC